MYNKTSLSFWPIKCTALYLIVIVSWAIFIYLCRDVIVERYFQLVPVVQTLDNYNAIHWINISILSMMA